MKYLLAITFICVLIISTCALRADVIVNGNVTFNGNIQFSQTNSSYGGGGTTPANLIAWYRFENNFLDCAPAHAYPATPTNSPTFTAGQLGQAAVFVASGSQIAGTAGNITELNSTNHFTVSVWFKRASSSSRVAIQYFKDADDYGIGIDAYSDGNVYFKITVNSGSYQYYTDNNTGWTMWTMTYDGTQSAGSRMLLYKNGSLVTASGSSGTIPAATASSGQIGAATNLKIAFGDGAYSDGQIDDFRIYGITLSAGEVLAAYTDSTAVCAP